jgi:hypothetical protein
MAPCICGPSRPTCSIRRFRMMAGLYTMAIYPHPFALSHDAFPSLLNEQLAGNISVKDMSKWDDDDDEYDANAAQNTCKQNSLAIYYYCINISTENDGREG